MKTASGFASLVRWMNGAKSGFFSGILIDPTTSPPPALNTFNERRFGVEAGAVVGDQRDHPLDLVLQAHSAIGAVTCGNVKPVRTM